MKWHSCSLPRPRKNPFAWRCWWCKQGWLISPCDRPTKYGQAIGEATKTGPAVTR